MMCQDLFESSDSSESEEGVLNFHLQDPVIQATVTEVDVVVAGANDIPKASAAEVLSRMQVLCERIHTINRQATVMECEILPRMQNGFNGSKLSASFIDRCNRIAADVNAALRSIETLVPWMKFLHIPGFVGEDELGEGWDENREAVTEGVTFYLKYLGSTLLDELPQGESYGEGVSSRAVQRIVDMARTQGRKLVKVCLKVTPHGIKVTDMDNKETLIDVTIYRISFCTADKNHDKLFAFIARNSINETMECHAFYCAKQKIAQAVTLSVSQAFNLAKDMWESAKNRKNSQNNTQKNVQESNKRLVETSHSTPPVPPRKVQSAPQIHLMSESHPRLPKPDTSVSLYSERTCSPRQGWATFDESAEDNVHFSLDTDSDNLDDCFSQLAENRSRKQSFPSFSTDLRQEDLDASVEEYMDGKKSLEAFSRTKSVEDLMNL